MGCATWGSQAAEVWRVCALQVRDITTQSEWLAAYEYSIPVLTRSAEAFRGICVRVGDAAAEHLQYGLEHPA